MSQSFPGVREMCVLVRNNDVDGIRKLARAQGNILRVSGHDFFWEAAKAHPMASDEELSGLLGVLRESGHLAAHTGKHSLHFFLEQGQLHCAGVLLDARGLLEKRDVETWMTGVLRDPSLFDLARAWEWRADIDKSRWQARLLAGGVLLGTKAGDLDAFHAKAPEADEWVIANEIQHWLSVHVVELASGEPSHLSPTESSTRWWLDTLGTERVKLLWQQTAAEHWPHLARLRAMVEKNLLDATTVSSSAAARARF